MSRPWSRAPRAFWVGLATGLAVCLVLLAVLLPRVGGDEGSGREASWAGGPGGSPSADSPGPSADGPSPSADSPSPTSSPDDSSAGESDAGQPAAREVPAPFDGPPAPLPSATPVTCPAATVEVGTAEQLTAALAAAQPGTSIRVADGVYGGNFTADTSGTAEQPVWLCGGAGAVLDAGGPEEGYALHLAPARWWRVVGLTVRNAQKGVVADATRGTVLQGLTVEDIGDEAVHLRAFSTGSAVLDCTVRRTGLRKPKFGEGVYVGSARSNWGDYSGGQPDRSDNVLVHGNRISATSSESVDVKEGTTGGVVSGNTFDGAGITGADSWVDVKGNDWLVVDNTGRDTPQNGFQTHEILDGWGTRNTFPGNTAATPPPGELVALTPVLANVVR